METRVEKTIERHNKGWSPIDSLFTLPFVHPSAGWQDGSRVQPQKKEESATLCRANIANLRHVFPAR